MFVRRQRLFWVTCAMMLVVSQVAMAQTRRFDIPAQPLPAALKAFAEQAHMQLLYVYNVVAEGRSNAVRGELERHEALDELLRGTGFEAAYVSDTEVTIRVTIHN